MLPAGQITEDDGQRSSPICSSAGDILIDGGNTFYKDDIRRAARAREAKGHPLSRCRHLAAACGGWSAAIA